jgi:hypothetical protein
MAIGRNRHQGLGTVLSPNEGIRQQSRSSGTVPLNSPRLLIRLTRCRKSGTVPLNSPRLLIRHGIPSTGLHTNKSQATRGVYNPPDTDSLCNTKTPNTTRSGTTRPLRETQVGRTPIDHSPLEPDDINRDQMPQYFLLTVGDLIPRATSKFNYANNIVTI